MNTQTEQQKIEAYYPAEKWQLRYDDGRIEEVSLFDEVLFHVPGGPKLGRIVHLIQEFESDEERLYRIGIGADWFWRLYVNGESAADYMSIGNQLTPIDKSNHIICFAARKGKNVLDIEVKSGAVTWCVAVGGIPENYDGLARLLERLKAPTQRPEDNCLQKLLPEDFFTVIRQGKFNAQFYPPATRRNIWEALRQKPEKQKLCSDILDWAEEALKSDIPQLKFSEYREYAENGNRSNYEEKYFSKRTNLGALTLAFALTGDRDKYLTAIFDYLRSILDEWTWCVPAHACWNKDTMFPQPHCQCDLFTGATVAMLALLVNVLGDEIQAVYPQLLDEIKEKSLHRGFYNPLSLETFDKNAWFSDEIPGNWTPWVSANVIISALVFETDYRRLAEGIQTYLKGVSRFIYHYPEDGFCMEGPSYFFHAGGNLFILSHFLNKIYPGAMGTFYSQEKIRNIFEFIGNVVIGHSVVSFSDAVPTFEPHLGSPVLKCCAAAIQSEKLRQTAYADVRCEREYDLLAKALMALFDVPENLPGNVCSVTGNAFYEDRLAVFKSEALSASLKSGCNAEYHNHNDMGHFSIWHRQNPIIVDAGMGLYNKTYFGVNRYTIWNTRGTGHNAPVFDNVEQQQGMEYRAAIRCSDNSAVCDLSAAYPKEAGVLQAVRELNFSDNQVTVKDSLQLASSGEVYIHLLTPVEPQVEDGAIRLGAVSMSIENMKLLSIVSIEEKLGRKPRWWQQLFEIRLAAGESSYKMTFTAEE